MGGVTPEAAQNEQIRQLVKDETGQITQGDISHKRPGPLEEGHKREKLPTEVTPRKRKRGRR